MHQYYRGHGFKSHLCLNFFKMIIKWDLQTITGRPSKVSNKPVVWSVEGPVYDEGVPPLPTNQSNVSSLSALVHVHQSPFSKSQYPGWLHAPSISLKSSIAMSPVKLVPRMPSNKTCQFKWTDYLSGNNMGTKVQLSL